MTWMIECFLVVCYPISLMKKKNYINWILEKIVFWHSQFVSVLVNLQFSWNFGIFNIAYCECNLWLKQNTKSNKKIILHLIPSRHLIHSLILGWRNTKNRIDWTCGSWKLISFENWNLISCILVIFQGVRSLEVFSTIMMKYFKRFLIEYMGYNSWLTNC